MRLISWNIAGRVKNNKKQVEALLSREPSIVCLQEVRKKSLETILSEFQKAGFKYFQDSVLIAEKHNRVKGNMVVSQYPFTHLSDYISTPRAESIISLEIKTPFAIIKIHNTHIPNGSSYGWIKIETFESIFKKLSSEEDNLRILCGDFNTPQAELPNGETVTWGQRISKQNEVILKRNRLRWHQGELSVIKGLADYNLQDVFRQLHGYDCEGFSFVVHRKGEIVSKRRFDHVFASQELHPQACKYLHNFQERNLSDHSPIEVLFSPNTK